MGIHFAIHTYGYFDAMFLIVNGIKMIMDSSLMTSLINLMAMISISYYSILIMYGAASGNTGAYFAKSAGMVLVIVSLLYPKADMLIVDRISGKKSIVTGLPYAFVLPVGALEALGAGITSMFEQVFSPVSSADTKRGFRWETWLSVAPILPRFTIGIPTRSALADYGRTSKPPDRQVRT